VQLHTAHASLDLFNQPGSQARISLAEETEVHGERIGCLEHPVDMPRSGGAGRRRRAGSRTRSSAHHGCYAGIERLLYLLRANEMYVRVDSTCGNDLAFPGDDFGPGSNYDFNAALHIGISGFADRGNESIPERDVGFNDSPMVKYECVGNDGV